MHGLSRRLRLSETQNWYMGSDNGECAPSYNQDGGLFRKGTFLVQRGEGFGLYMRVYRASDCH